MLFLVLFNFIITFVLKFQTIHLVNKTCLLCQAHSPVSSSFFWMFTYHNMIYIIFTLISGNIIIATPGRLEDMFRRQADGLDLVSCVKTLDVLILDEADRLLDMGFEARWFIIWSMSILSVESLQIAIVPFLHITPHWFSFLALTLSWATYPSKGEQDFSQLHKPRKLRILYELDCAILFESL